MAVTTSSLHVKASTATKTFNPHYCANNSSEDILSLPALADISCQHNAARKQLPLKMIPTVLATSLSCEMFHFIHMLHFALT